MGAFLNALSTMAKDTAFQVKKHSPEILIGAGIASTVLAMVFVRKAAKKEDEIIDKAKEDLKKIQDYKEHPESCGDGYTQEDARKDTARVYLRTTGSLLLLYSPAIMAETAAIAGILGGTKILNNRNAAIAAAMAAGMSDFKEYRKRLIEKFGDEGEMLDAELRYGLKPVEVKETETDENGKKKTVKKTVYVLDSETDDFDGYKRLFDQRNSYWDHTPCYNTFFLSGRQSMLNDRLRADGYLFLNDVLDALGFPKTRIGQEVGWVYDPNSNDVGDNYVDFRATPVRLIIGDKGVEGIQQLDHEECNCAYLLDFNVDGSVLNRVKWNDER